MKISEYFFLLAILLWKGQFMKKSFLGFIILICSSLFTICQCCIAKEAVVCDGDDSRTIHYSSKGRGVYFTQSGGLDVTDYFYEGRDEAGHLGILVHHIEIRDNPDGSTSVYSYWVWQPNAKRISNIETIDSISIFPNPATSFINVIMSGISGNEAYRIDISDTNGNRVYSNPNNDSGDTKISCDQFLNGTYFVVIYNNNQIETVQKIIINK